VREASQTRSWITKILKVTVELSDQEMADVLEFNGERKRGLPSGA
jgi:hypothetical protein